MKKTDIPRIKGESVIFTVAHRNITRKYIKKGDYFINCDILAKIKQYGSISCEKLG